MGQEILETPVPNNVDAYLICFDIRQTIAADTKSLLQFMFSQWISAYVNGGNTLLIDIRKKQLDETINRLLVSKSK